jgi:hypothetical protein
VDSSYELVVGVGILRGVRVRVLPSLAGVESTGIVKDAAWFVVIGAGCAVVVGIIIAASVGWLL